MKKIKACLYFLIFLLLSPTVQAGLTISLWVNVLGGQPDQGKVILTIFSSAENFLKRPIDKKTMAVNGQGEALFQIDSLQPGTYAISIVYDEDDNGKLNTGFLGIPTEPVGFSNNVKGKFGPPSFNQTSFHLDENSKIVIYLGNAKE